MVTWYFDQLTLSATLFLDQKFTSSIQYLIIPGFGWWSPPGPAPDQIGWWTNDYDWIGGQQIDPGHYDWLSHWCGYASPAINLVELTNPNW